MANLILAHAVGDENDKAKGGKAGDQTGKEVRFQSYYDREKGWTNAFRAKEKELREVIAQAAVDGVANDKIGYDQGQRLTLYDEAEKVSFKLSNITKACETDCSAFATVCLAAAGIMIDKSTYTGNMEDNIVATGKMKNLKADKYLHSTANLQEGDILLGPGHAAIVVSDERRPSKKAVYTEKVRVQIAACRNAYSAATFVELATKAGYTPYIVEENGYKRIIAMLCYSKEEAFKVAGDLNRKGFATYVYSIGKEKEK